MSENRMTEKVRILIVDDHSLVRSGFRLLLERIEHFEVVGEAGDGNTAIQLIDSVDIDVLITDIAMPEMTGLDLVKHVKTVKPAVRCILLSMHKAAPYVKSAIASGAEGYLLKDSVDAELELAVKTILQGSTYLSPRISQTVVDGLDGTKETPFKGLTGRQTEVLKRMAGGSTTKEIARDLGVSPKTIETHRSHLMKRLGIYDVANLVKLAIREGLVDLEDV